MRIDLEQGGYLLLNKPYEWSSFQATKKVQFILKKHFNTKKIKIGHAGTLDPLATGLLILCVGKYTKRIEEFQAKEKEYTGVFTLGGTTASYDKEKPIDTTYPTNHITRESILQTAESFLGEQMQTPPIFSAIKVGGVRAYSKARDGKDIEIKQRRIHIAEFEITDVQMPDVSFRIRCSKGTYIRSIARDFGERLQSGAYLSSLCRTKIGEHSLDEALSIEQIADLYPPHSPSQS